MGAFAAGIFGGISEPSLYGILLRFRRSYYRLLPGCALGGVVMGLFDVKANAFVFTSALTINAFDPWSGYAIGVLVAFTTSLLLTLFFGYRTAEEKEEAQRLIAERREAERREASRDDAALDDAHRTVEDAGTAEPGDRKASDAAQGSASAPVAASAATTATAGAGVESGVVELDSPLAGHAVPLSEVPDPIFAGAKLGEGVAVQPTGTTVYAPADGKVLTVQKSGHAVGLNLDNGVQLLIHVGIDTVELGGEGFTVHVDKKQRVSAGDKLISFDPEFITARGYNLITPVVVTNSAKCAGVDAVEGEVTPSDTLLRVFGK